MRWLDIQFWLWRGFSLTFLKRNESNERISRRRRRRRIGSKEREVVMVPCTRENPFDEWKCWALLNGKRKQVFSPYFLIIFSPPLSWFIFRRHIIKKIQILVQLFKWTEPVGYSDPSPFPRCIQKGGDPDQWFLVVGPVIADWCWLKRSSPPVASQNYTKDLIRIHCVEFLRACVWRLIWIAEFATLMRTK